MENKKIMIIDDDVGILEVVKIILEDNGYEAISVDVDTEDQLLKTIEEVKPAMIFLDLWMPGINGGDVCEKIKLNPAIKTIPVVLLSAAIDTKEIAKKTNADGFLTKPFEMDDLVAKARQFVAY